MTWHLPPLHAVSAPGSEHAAPQPPQLVTDVVVSTSHPLDATPSQSANPDAHAAIWHAPLPQ